jgi:hypothetical protein
MIDEQMTVTDPGHPVSPPLGRTDPYLEGAIGWADPLQG